MQIPSTKVDRKGVFSEPSTRELLRRLVVEEKRLTPDVGPDGRIRYPLADEVFRGAWDSRAWIKDMLDLGILQESGHKDVVMCPTHSRTDANVELECAKCKARSQRKTSLVEHVYCGYIGDDTGFNKGGIVVCPNCKTSIGRPEEMKVAGVWYECKNCLTKTNSPKIVFVCREGHDYTISDLALVPVYTYEVNSSVIGELKNTLILAPSLGAMLTSLGFTVSSPASVRGTSGAEQSLDVYAKKGDTDIALQISVDSKPVEPTAVISFFAKVYDIKPKLSVLITIPSASPAARQLNEGYGILLVEDADGAGAVEKVKEGLRLLQGRL